MMGAGPTLVLAAALAADGAAPEPPPPTAVSGGDGPGVHLSWVRGDGAGTCPDAAAIEAEVAARLGSNPFARRPTQFLEAVVTQRPDGHQVHIAMRGADGKLLGNRSLTSTTPDCRSIATAAALTIAILIDPDVLARPPPPAPPPPPPPPTVTQQQPPQPPEASFPPGRVMAQVGAGWGLLPGTAPGAGLAATADVSRRAAIGVSTVFFPERRTAAPDDGFAFGLAYGQLVGCFVLTPAARVRWEVCAGGNVGVLHAVVLSAEPAGPGQRWTFAVAELTRVIIPLWGAAGLEIGLEATQPLPRRAFFVEGRPAGMDTVFTQPISAFTGWLGVGLRWR